MQLTIETKKLKIIGAVFVVLITIILIQGFAKKNTPAIETELGGTEQLEDIEDIKAEKIQVVHFHTSYQCWSCIELGKMAKKTLENRFPEELESGRVEFLEINVDLPENSEITKKFKATGSSLFTNIIYEKQDHIEEEVEVWRLLGSEIQFRKYLGDKLEEYL